MINTAGAQIESVFVHWVGNPTRDEMCKFSSSALDRSEELDQALETYFLRAFKSEAFYEFSHSSDLDLNEVFAFVRKIFRQPDAIKQQSINIARHLYESSDHPNIKSGEFYVAYFTECLLDGEIVDAVGLFKSENKDTYLKVEQGKETINLETETGINLNKLDKGCLIFNTDEEDGYRVVVVDQTNKGLEAQYWTEDFLGLKQCRDTYFNTQQVLSACKTFISEELPEQYEIDKADQIDLLNRSIDYFKKHETFEKEEFEGEVFRDNDVIKSFQSFNQAFTEESEIPFEDSFEISKQAVQKKSRVFKSVLKLDKNFHVYIHGNRDMIERGVDENGRKYYKIYYEKEQ